jgi:hypothetical protein
MARFQKSTRGRAHCPCFSAAFVTYRTHRKFVRWNSMFLGWNRATDILSYLIRLAAGVQYANP